MTNQATAAPVTAADKVSDVLARSESLVEVFVRHAPHFAKLRNKAMRRIMARLVTVEQAARTANVPAERLVSDLNEALGIAASPADVAEPAPASPAAREESALTHPKNANVVELDVRDDLRFGREPFSKIMLAVAGLADDDVLLLRTIFEPAPLFSVLARRGFAHESRANAADDWSAWFWRQDAHTPNVTPVESTAAGDQSASLTAVPSSANDDDRIVWLDVRGLQPPEPLMRTLTAIETLPAGHVLVQINSRVPQLLFPMLAEQGFACEVDESRADAVFVRIWRNTSPSQLK
jgi:TusA-related sulfurtransferase